MNTQPALPTSTAALRAYSRAQERGKKAVSGLSLTGVLLFVIGFLVLASGYLSMRPKVMGLSLHPYLIPVALAAPLVLLARLNEFPVRVLTALLVFTGMYFFSVMSGKGFLLGEIFKFGSGVATILVVALLVRRPADFVAGALGLSVAIALLAVRALQVEQVNSGFEVMEGANKNSYSLFALPAMLMAGFIATRMTTVPVLVRGLLVVSTLPALAATFMSANRSGYLGAALIGFMLFWDRRGRGTLVVAAVVLAMVYYMTAVADTSVFNERMKQTAEGTHSDEQRVKIIKTCTQIALENPIIGVSPSQVAWEIGRRTSSGAGQHINYLDSHNVFAHVAAASGLICFAALLAMGATLWTLKPSDGKGYKGRNDPARQALTLIRMMVVLWVVRGMFTREILYNPACNIALGLCIGLFIVSQSVRPDSDAEDEKSPPPGVPANGQPATGAA